jgi:hypothetical protein
LAGLSGCLRDADVAALLCAAAARLGARAAGRPIELGAFRCASVADFGTESAPSWRQRRAAQHHPGAILASLGTFEAQAQAPGHIWPGADTVGSAGLARPEAVQAGLNAGLVVFPCHVTLPVAEAGEDTNEREITTAISGSLLTT